MTLSALLVCTDEASAKVLRRVLQELSIQVESCTDFSRAAMRLVQQRFDVVIVDGDSGTEVVSLLRETRQSRLNDATLAVAVVPSQDSIRELFSLGVNFVLYKPVEHDRALSSLRAARAVMRREKRKNARAAVHTHATIDYANVAQEKATLIDLGQDGMAVLFGKKLPPVSKVYFQFALPGQELSIRLSGQVIWQDWNGRAGVQFVDVPKTSRKLLADYLSANLPSDITEELPDVVVDVEDPLHVTAMAVIDQSHGGEKSEHKIELEPKVEQSAPVNSAVAAEPDPNNRRTQARYACRLGAEVYRTGSSVPNHCCLTDLSAGGCYLEVSLPFPQGSPVEIVVRTHEMKLRLSGLVQTSHPGYGMGIAFDLKTKDDQANVKKLTDFVAATTEPA
ncbi:MAG: PilZ domain-containing protein [Candidatus Sulfotelmatobacter sp.]